MTRVISLLVLGLMALSCEPESTVPDQNKIYGTYFLDYNASIDKTTARATFYLETPSNTNTQKLELTHPATVKYNEKQLVFETQERHYFKEFAGEVESNFIYMNYNGNQFSNHIDMVDSISVFMSDSANADNDFYFQVDGAPLAANETIDIYIESLNSGFSLGSSFTNLAGLNVQISSSQLTSLGIGPSVIRASRRLSKSVGVNGPPVGGEVQTCYSVQDTVYIF